MLNKILFPILFSILIFSNGFSQELEKLDDLINSKYDEISPVLSPDGSRLYFTRIGYPIYNSSVMKNGQNITAQMTKPQRDSLIRKIFSDLADKPILDIENSIYNQDIWYAELDEYGDIIRVVHPSEPLNNAFPNSVLAVIENSGELILVNQYGEKGVREGISIYNEKNENQLNPLNIANYGSLDGVIHLTASADGRVIIWSLERMQSYGGRDLYISFKIDRGVYSAPRNLGPIVNSPYRESSPFLASDGKTLYFSSNRPGGMGGMDIYYTERLDNSWRKWSKPIAMDPPINSGYDDSQPMLSPDGNFFYFTSRREGSSDIYRHRKNKREEPVIVNLTLDGLVIDQESGDGVAADIAWSEKNNEKSAGFFSTTSGEFMCNLITGKDYVFTAKARGYHKNTIEVKLKRFMDTTTTNIKISIPLQKKEKTIVKTPSRAIEEKVIENKPEEKIIEISQVKMEDEEIVENPTLPEDLAKTYTVEKTVVMRSIYFKRSEAVVLKASLPALNDLYKMMVNNPHEHILISGHTDNIGPEDLLIKLSKDRANTIKAYLLRRGITADRIKTIGYGAQKPINENSSEQEREANRRVEISFLSKL